MERDDISLLLDDRQGDEAGMPQWRVADEDTHPQPLCDGLDSRSYMSTAHDTYRRVSKDETFFLLQQQ